MAGRYEPEEVRLWLMAKLVPVDWDDLLPGGWHRGIAPIGTPYPFGSFHPQGFARSTRTLSQVRILSNGLWAVFATGIEGQTDANLATIAERIDGALDRASGSAGAGFVYGSTWEIPWDRTYRENDVTYVENGGQYRIWV